MIISVNLTQPGNYFSPYGVAEFTNVTTGFQEETLQMEASMCIYLPRLCLYRTSNIQLVNKHIINV